MSESRWQFRDYVVIFLILAFTIGIRLYLALDVPYVIGEESYHWLRQIDSIKQTGYPISQDPLYVGSRQFESLPIFSYLISLPAFIGPIEVWGKIFINLFAAIPVILAFLICTRTTKSRYVAYLTGFFAGFIPIYWESTVHSLSIYALVLPLFMACIYFFLEITIAKKKVAKWYVFLLLLYACIHPSVFFLIGGFLIYLVLLKVEGLKVNKAEWELTLFTVLVASMIQIILNKDILITHGINTVTQNIPVQIIGNYFAQTTLLQAFYRIGEIPVIFGMVIIAKFLFREKNKTVYLFISFALGIGITLWLRLIEPRIGMMFVGAILTLLFSFYYTFYLDYVPNTKFSQILPLLKLGLFITFILTSILPSVQLTNAYVDNAQLLKHHPAMEWIKEHTPENAVIITDPSQGALVTTFANRTIVSDLNFLKVDNAQHRVNQIEKLYTTPYETRAVQIMEEFDANYIYVDKRLMNKKYNKTQLSFIDRFKPSDCFARVYNRGSEIYLRTCEVKKLS